MAVLVNDLNQLVDGAASRVDGASVSVSGNVAYFTIAAGATDTSPTTITLTATINGYITPTYAWYEIIGGVPNLLVGEVTNTLVVTGDTAWITALGTETYVQYKVTATETGYNTAEAIFNLPVLRDGVVGTSASTYWMVSSVGTLNKDALGVFTPTSVTFTGKTATGSGTPTDYAGRFRVYENGSGIASYTSASDEISTTWTPSSSSVFSIKAELYLAGGTVTEVDLETIPVTEDGATGIDGPGAVIARLSTPNKSLNSDYGGSVSSYSNSGTNIQVFEGETALTYRTTLGANVSSFTVGTPVQTPTSVLTIGSITGNLSITAVVADHSAMVTGTDAVLLSFPITYNRADGTSGSLTAVQSVVKVRNGTNGLSVVFSNPAWPLISDSAGTVSTYVGSGTTIQVYDGGGSPLTITACTITGTNITAGTASGLPSSTATISAHSAIVASTASISYALTVTRADGTSASITDRQIVYKSIAGTNGLTVLFGNPSWPLICDSAGTVSTYTGSGTTIQVYEGTASPLTITACTATGTNITAGSVSGVGTNTVTIGNHATITTTSASVSYTLTVTRANGTSATVTDKQAVYKSIAGVSGDKTAEVVLYQWAYSSPALPVSTTTTTYTWVDGTIALGGTATSWTVTPATDTVPGKILYKITKPITVAGTITSTIVYGNASGSSPNWTGVVPSAISKNSDNTFRCYNRWVGNSAVPTGTVTTAVGSFPSYTAFSVGAPYWVSDPFSASIPTLVTGQTLWICDGVTNSAGQIVWGTPYLSSFKVGSLEALSATLGSVNSGTITTTTFTGGTIQTSSTTNADRIIMDSTSFRAYNWDGAILTQRVNISVDGAGWFGAANKFYWDNVGSVTASGLTIKTDDSSTTRIELTTTGFKAYNAGTQRVYIATDGSGWLGASDKLYWTNAGVVTANGLIVQSGATSNKVSLTSSGLQAFNATPTQTVNISSTDGSGWFGTAAGFSWNSAGAITATGITLQTASSGSRVAIDSTNGLTAFVGATQRAKIAIDGSGWFGSSTGFAWDASGNVSVTNLTATNGTITGSLVQTASSGSRVAIDSTNGLRAFTGATQRANIALDGSGWFGTSTALSWTAGGVVTAEGITIRTSSSTSKVELTSTELAAYNSGTKTVSILATGAGWLGTAAGFAWDTAGAITATGLTIRTSSSTSKVELTSTELAAYNAGTKRVSILATGAGWLGTSTGFSWDTAGAITATGITVQTASSGSRVELTASNGIRAYNGATQRVNIATDGSGWFGSASGLVWDSSGNVSATNLTIANGTITGSTIQTAASGTRIALNASSSNKIEVYNSTNLLARIGGTIDASTKHTGIFQAQLSATYSAGAGVAGYSAEIPLYSSIGVRGTSNTMDGTTGTNQLLTADLATVNLNLYTIGIYAINKSKSTGDLKQSTFEACYRDQAGSGTHTVAGRFAVEAGATVHGKFEILDTAYEVKLTASLPTFKMVSNTGGARTWSVIGGDTYAIWTTGPATAAVSLNSDNLVTMDRIRLTPRSSAPSPLVDGMIVSANRTGWDPAGKGSGGSYPVYYNGSTWTALY